jgi:hypothetical protein
MDELQRLEELKKEALANPLKKKRGCKDCKKKADQPVEALAESVEEEPIGPTEQDIKLALDLMNGKPNEKDTKFIQWVHKSLFGDEIQPGCGGCGATAERRLRYRYNLIRGVKG